MYKICRVSLSGLLNVIDGVGAQEGRIMFATTNKLESLDKALSRVGRMDVCVEFKLANAYQARNLFKWFYAPGPNTSLDDSTLEKSSSTEHDYLSTSVSIVGGHRGSHFSRADIDRLADDFARVLPEYRTSMASLQGYLMRYKLHPSAAVDGLTAWIEQGMDSVGDAGSLKTGGATVSQDLPCSVAIASSDSGTEKTS